MKITEKGMQKKLTAHYRELIRERDGNRCQWCGSSQGKMDVHHVIPKGRCLRLKWDEKNLILLCFSCHYKWHYRGEGRQWFDEKYPERIEYLLEHEHEIVKRRQFIKQKYDELK